MVTDSIRNRRRDDGSDDERRDRGQVILIGAITLAFIILGVVVIFNGVLYTETLSSADTGQAASDADATELEIKQGVACLVAEHDDDELDDIDSFEESDLHDDIEAYAEVYQNSTAHSQPAAVDIATDDGFLDDLLDDDEATVIVTYDSNDISYERTLEIDPDECPGSHQSSGSDDAGGNGEGDNGDDGGNGEGDNGDDGGNGESDSLTIDQFDIDADESTGQHQYTITWSVSGTDLSNLVIELSDEGGGDEESPPVSGSNEFDETTLQSQQNDDVEYIEIAVEDDAGNTEDDRWTPD